MLTNIPVVNDQSRGIQLAAVMLNYRLRLQKICTPYYRTNGHQFKWYGCWLILKDTSKWFHHMQEQEGRKEKIAQRKKCEGTLDVDEIVCPSNPSTPVTPSLVGALISLDDNISRLNDGPTDLLRPTGRKETKNPRRMKKGDQSEGVNFIFSEFSNMRKE
ncbi:hypothetical protein RHGRI_022234 [Rhododendron griersonianum]|uniref:No apical meristem-associated C-terminal domain-containing protein n=1 Tax=Rhododendron griersonianum TaxID=479676 RepID=A0AAV6JPK7_9ERIC|nr:hypothetical protein RHGRI_022234 [Rhododendron griersonianum]